MRMIVLDFVLAILWFASTLQLLAHNWLALLFFVLFPWRMLARFRARRGRPVLDPSRVQEDGPQIATSHAGYPRASPVEPPRAALARVQPKPELTIRRVKVASVPRGTDVFSAVQATLIEDLSELLRKNGHKKADANRLASNAVANGAADLVAGLRLAYAKPRQ